MQVLSFLTVLVMFVQSQAYISPMDVDMRSAASYAVIGSSTVTNTGNSKLTGNLALHPGTSVTGFPPGECSGTMQIDNGAALQAKNDLEAASLDAASRMPDQALDGDAGGMTLAPGVYLSSSSLQVTGTLKLDCATQLTDPVWIFQIVSTLVLATGATVEYVNCPYTSSPKVYWNVGSSATLQTTSTIVGTVMAYQSITTNTGATTGALMAREAAVTLDTNAVTVPSSYVWPVPATDDTPIGGGTTNSAGASDASSSQGFQAGVAIAAIVVFLALAGGVWYVTMGRQAAETASAKALTASTPAGTEMPKVNKTRFEEVSVVEGEDQV